MSTATETPAKGKGKAPLWWRVARGTARGTGIVARIIYIESRYTYGIAKTRTRARYKAWQAERNFTADDQPEFDEVPRKRRRAGRTQYLCLSCGRKYKSAAGLNAHYRNVHSAERAGSGQPPNKIRGTHATGKVRVQPSQAASPRAGKTTPNMRSANPMNSSIAQALKAAWARMAEARPTLLSEIRDDMVGLEQALGGHASEAIDQYRMHLIRDGFNPAAVRNLARAKEKLEEAGREFSGVIAKIEEEYAAEIAAARRRKGTTRPSDNTLAN